MPKAKRSDSTVKRAKLSSGKSARRKTISSATATEADLVVTDDNETGDESADSDQFSVVGIGASAGGYEALQQLVEQLPTDTGMAFVVVQHLDPKHESKLSELLSRSSRLPLQEATRGLVVRSNHIYVIPPNVNLAVTQGRIQFQPRKANVPHMPIDFCFRSLAKDPKSRAIGVVLSGTGTDGTLGLQAIKGAGGLTFAQDEKSAKYFGMPGSAIASGYVDIVLAPDAIARELGRIARHPYVRQSEPAQPSRKPTDRKETEKAFEGQEAELQAVFSMLRVRTGVDFSLYKHSTLRRRIIRRMLLHRIEGLPAYVHFTRTHPGELEALFDDLLINVTGFFRDPRVFQILKRRIYPKLMRGRSGERPLRVWVCGCSTGEEAYSLAISLVEFFEATHRHATVQIFATDVSEAALEKARAGVYPESIAQDVSPERLRRFFVKNTGSYQVSKSIRDMVVFARQNVVVDPPFSNLDMISCRNVLIYLGQPLQKKVMPVFHYALKAGGYLLLGSSEAIGAASHLFGLVDKKQKIYTKKLAASTPLNFSPAGRPRPEPVPAIIEPKTPDLQQVVDRLILAHWSPAAVAVNAQMDVLLFRGRTSKYLEHAAGNASLNLSRMMRPGLGLGLRTVISRATRQDTAVREENVPLQHETAVEMVSIDVIPFRLTPSSERLFLVLFHDLPPTQAGRQDSGLTVRALDKNNHRELGKLREELASSKESLQAIIEEQEATNEELKSANEEVMSSNEELQSANEELETAKEELQSTNEELTTLNEELQNRNVELSQVNNDLTNLLASVPVGIVMVTSDLVIRRFTPLAARLFNLIPNDVGRRLSDLNRNIIAPDLDEAILEVVENLASVEREVQDSHGRWYSLRIRPYRTRENKIDGAVMVLVDIDEHRRAVDLIMETITHPLLALNADLRVKRANAAFYRAFNLTHPAVENHYIYEVDHGQWNVPRLKTLLEDVLVKENQVNDFEIQADFPELGRRTMRVDARSYTEGARGSPLILLSFKDIIASGEIASADAPAGEFDGRIGKN
jgi:two-component system CheB/CheR fusion protein